MELEVTCVVGAAGAAYLLVGLGLTLRIVVGVMRDLRDMQHQQRQALLNDRSARTLKKLVRERVTVATLYCSGALLITVLWPAYFVTCSGADPQVSRVDP